MFKKFLIIVLISFLVSSISIKATSFDEELELAMTELELLEIENEAVEVVETAISTVVSKTTKLNANQQILFDACTAAGIVDMRQMANVFAQVQIESGFVPKSEIRQVETKTARQRYIKRLQDRYWFTGYFGRGLIQITHLTNYERLGAIIGVDLVNNPEKANEMNNAASIACIGMRDGLFTSIKLSDCINNKVVNYRYCRRIVNGRDKEGLVDILSKEWYKKLTT